MKEILKTFEDTNVEILIDENENPWFVAKDICLLLDIKNSRDAVAKLDEDEKLMSVVATSGQNRNVNLVNESGLYSLIFLSRKPVAKKFKKWVTSEVLPSIRKKGYYSVKDISKLIEEENTSYEKQLEAVNGDINKYFVSLSKIEEFREYNNLLSQKKSIIELINENNKAIKINARHKNKILA